MNTEAVNAWLRSRGIDPDKVTVDPNTGEVTDRLEPAKTAESTSTALGAGGRALAHGIIPAAAGVAGAGLAAAAMPVTGGLSGFAIPLLAGLGASAGTAAIQEKLLPEEAKARLAKDVEEHPIAATVGGAAAQLPFMRPSLNTVRQAGAGVRSLLNGAGAAQVRPEQLAALSNIAAGGAIGGGIQAGRDALHGEFNPTEIAKATAEGLIFHEPTVIGRKVSFGQFHQTPEHKPDEWSNVDMATAGQKSPSTLAREQEEVALEKFKPLSYALDKAEIPYDPTVPGIDAAVNKLKPFRDPAVLGTAKSKAEELVAKLTAERDQWKATHPEATAAVETKLAKAQADLDFYNKVPKFYEAFNDQLAGLDPKSPQNIAKMTKFAEQQGQTRAEAMPGKEEEAKIVATAKGIREESDRITAEREAEAKRIAEEQADPKWSKTGGARFQPVVDDTVPPAPSSERVRGSNWDEAATAVGKRFGATVEHVPEVKVETTGPDGKKTIRYRSASADPLTNPTDQALIKISDAAGLDAAPHELWHTIADRLRRGSSAERRFVNRTVESAIASHPDLAEAHAQRMYGKKLSELTPDERFEVGHEVSTQKIGEHLVSRLHGDDSFFSDVGAYLSNKFGRASDAQLTRLASNIIRRGKGFETTGGVAPNVAAVGARFQPLGPSSDPRFTNESPERSKNPFASPVEALRRTSSPDNRAFADAAEKLHNDERVLNGRFTNALQKVWLDLGKENAAKAWEHGHDEMRAGRILPTTPEIRSALDTYRGILRAMHENQRAAGHTNVLGEEVSDNPLYMPGVESNAARQILAERVGSADFNTLKADFIKAQEDAGFSSEEAEALFEKKRSGLLGSDDLSKNFSFKAVDLPSGVKLPASWTEADPVAATRKYGNRWSKARAWWDVVQSDPTQMKRLGSTTFKHGEAIPEDTVAENISANPNVKDILGAYARGMKVSTEPVIPAIGRFLNSLILAGPTTKLTDIGTTLFKGMAYAPAGSQLKVITHAFKNWRQSLEHSYEQGLNKRGDSVVMSQMLGAGEHVANRLDSITEGIVKWTGAEAMEKTSRGLAQGIGEFIAEAQRGLAATGDKRAQQFLAKLGADHATASIPELGTRIGQLLQGKYDITNTARWLHDSPLAPFMSMMRWSVEQTNNFNRFVLEPLVKHKDPVPLFAHLIAGAAGGVVLNQVREWLSGHKDQLASWDELSKNLDAPGAKKELAMKLIAALQVTGTAGIVSEMVKQGADVASGQMPQGFHYPVIDTAGDIGLRLAGLADAMRSGEDPVKYLTKFTIDVTRHNIQVARLAIDAAGKAGVGPTADDSAERDAKRDLRVFNRLKDYPANQSVPLVPSYSNLTEKSLDRETDMHKAAGIAQELTHRAFARFAETHDMVELTSALRKIKTAPDTAVPSPDRDPVKFQRYIKYIADTQGQAAADELVKQTFRGKAMRAAKASMVPSIGR